MPVIACPDCGRDVSTVAEACPHCGRPSPAGTVPIAPQAVQQAPEETLWKGSPSWTLLIGHLAVIVVTLVVIPLLAHFAAKATSDLLTADRIVRAGWWITMILVLLESLAFLFSLARLRSTVYTVTNQRVMIETGMLTRSLGEIDLRYIDDSQFFQGVMHRMVGIGNVTLVSSDKAMPVYVLRGIRDPRGVREMIRTHAYKVSQRQIFTRAT
jgi:uncharacterized membrane protein YdbT with pleckstrin-like domain